MGMTMAEKILAKASGREVVKPGEYVTAEVDHVMVHNLGFSHSYPVLREAGVDRVWDPQQITVLMDHRIPPSTIANAEDYKLIREGVKKLGIIHWYDMTGGICHQLMPEKGHVLPGRLILGSDSHSTTYGAFGAAGTAIGASEMAYVLATGELWMRVPPSIKFVLKGDYQPRVMSKDLILHIAGKYSTDAAQYKAVEFTGETAHDMSISSRMTVSNMGVEIGAKFAFFEADDKTVDFLKGRTKEEVQTIKADYDAVYEATYEVNVSGLEPQVAFPHDVGNVRPISEVGDIEVNQAFVGSCTNGRLEDLEMAAEIVKGKRVHPNTRFLVFPASYEIYLEAMRRGILETLILAGAVVCNPGCGPCGGSHMGVLASGERCISASNRNFKGRMGSPEAEVYLGSPATVAASAIAGKIVNPRLA